MADQPRKFPCSNPREFDVIPTNQGQGASIKTQQMLSGQSVENFEMSPGMTLTSDPVKDGIVDDDSLQRRIEEVAKYYILDRFCKDVLEIVLEQTRAQTHLESNHRRSQNSMELARTRAQLQDALKRISELKTENRRLQEELDRLRGDGGRSDINCTEAELSSCGFLGAKMNVVPRQTESVGNVEQNKSIKGIILEQERRNRVQRVFEGFMDSPPTAEPNLTCREKEADVHAQQQVFPSSGYSSLTSHSNQGNVSVPVRPYGRANSSEAGKDWRVPQRALPQHAPPRRFLSEEEACVIRHSCGEEVIHSHPIEPWDPRNIQLVHEPNLNPEEVAFFLAEKVQGGDVYSTLLRSMGLSSTDIYDIKGRHPNDPREERIEGIKTAFTRARDRNSTLVRALLKAGLLYEAELFCEEFHLDRRLLEDQQPKQQRPRGLDQMIPAPKPKNDFERVLIQHLKDPHNVNQLTDVMSKERKLNQEEQKRFREAFHQWKTKHRNTYDKALVSSSLLCVMNAWAAVVLDEHSQQEQIPGVHIEYLLRSCRAIRRIDFVRKLKQYLHTGVSGPTLERSVYLREIGNKLKRELIQQLDLNREDGNDWQALAERMGYNQQIPHWQSNKRQTPAAHLWEAWSAKTATIGQLYDWTLEATRLDITAIMESET